MALRRFPSPAARPAAPSSAPSAPAAESPEARRQRFKVYRGTSAAGTRRGARRRLVWWRENSGDATLCENMNSAQLSSAIGMPVVLFHLDEAPHAFAAPEAMRPFTKTQMAARRRWLRENIQARAWAAGKTARPHREIAAEEDGARRWRDLAAQAAEEFGGAFAHMSREVPERPQRRSGHFRLRLGAPEGYRDVTQLAVVALPDRRWSAADDWRWFTLLKPGQLENWPGKNASGAQTPQEARSLFTHYLFLHETGHLLQRGAPASFAARWEEELDADRFAFEQMEKYAREKATPPAKAEALREMIEAVQKGRALGAFLGMLPEYAFAPALRRPAPDQPEPEPEACRSANCELQLRVWCDLNGRALDRSSAQIQAGYRAMGGANGAIPGDAALRLLIQAAEREWESDKIDAAQALPALRRLHRQGAFTDPLVRRNAALVLDAADYFCPRLLRGLVPVSAPPRPANSNRPGPDSYRIAAARKFHRPGQGRNPS